MRKFILLGMIVGLLAFAGGVNAQNRFEGFVGATFVRQNVNVRQVPSFTFNKSTDSVGGIASLTGYFNDSTGNPGILGVTAEVAGSTNGTSRGDSSLVTAMAGLQLKARNASIVQPFVRAEAGLGRQRLNNDQISNVLSKDNTGFAFSAGAGVDLKIGKHVAFRAIEADYLQTRIEGSRVNSVRLSTGLVF